jgi:DNA-3-methyladenine glycosylase
VKRLDAAFFAREPQVVAAELIGKRLVHEVGGRTLTGRIVETEAYLGPEDLASHARFGPAGRSRPLFGPPGVVYVFLIYGMHECFNVVTREDGQPSAVLVRALEPGEGIAPCNGPGRLTKALGIDRRLNGTSVEDGPAWIGDAGETPPRLATTARIGVDYARHWARRKLRWVDADSRALSVRLPAKRPRRAK